MISTLDHFDHSHPSKDVLQNFVEGKSTHADTASLETHIATCPECASVLEQLELPGNLGNRLRNAIAAVAGSDDQTIDSGLSAEDLKPYLKSTSRADALGQLGHYDILKVVGRGAFGIVLQAFDNSLNRIVALKVLAPQFAAFAPSQKRFLREARAAAAVCHENVVQIYSVHESPIPHIVMEYVPGETLQDRLNRSGPLGQTEVERIARGMAAGLAAAHAQGLIHRDIKPSNVLLDDREKQRVKISDFGLAQSSDDAPLTRSGVIAGTPMFMSPEQAHGEVLDARSDLFSLGSVLYTLLSGKTPFPAPNPMAVLKRVCEVSPEPLRTIVPDLSPALSNIVERLHEKQLERRFQSAIEVQEALDRMTSEGTSSPSIAVPASTSSPRKELPHPEDTLDSTLLCTVLIDPKPITPKRRWSTVLLGMLAGVVVCAAAIFIIQSSHGQYVVKVDDPQVAIKLNENGGLIVEDQLTKTTYQLTPGANRLPHGDYNLTVKSPDGLELETPQFTLKRWNKVVVTVTARPVKTPERPSTKPNAPENSGATDQHQTASAPVTPQPTPDPTQAPPPMFAPANLATAKAAQSTWSLYLKQPVEMENSIGMKLRLIPPGEFQMGAPDDDQTSQPHERPQHPVRLTKPFYLGALEVTVGQFRTFVEATKYVTQAESDGQGSFEINPKIRRPEYQWNKIREGETLPVTCVSWEDACKFCEWLGKKEGRVYRLPTEAEWEFACRAGTTSRYAFGDEYDKQKANGAALAMGAPLSVGAQFAPNAFGLYDMHGNVNEICLDAARPYSSELQIDPVGFVELNQNAVVRGGAASSSPPRLRSSQRYLLDSRAFPERDFATGMKGFRVVALLSPETKSPQISAPAPRPELDPKAFPPELAAHPLISTEWEWSEPENLGRKIYPAGPIHESFVSLDEKTLVFRHGRTTFTSVRSSSKEPFPVAVPLMNDEIQIFPSLSVDGLHLSYCSGKKGGIGNFDLWERHRPSLQEPFGEASNLGAPLNSREADGQACYSSDGLTILFCSTRAGGLGSDDFWQATRTAVNQPFSQPKHCGPRINSPAQDFCPRFCAGDRILLFSSPRDGTRGQFDIWISLRDLQSNEYGPPMNLGTKVNTIYSDGRPSLSEDGQTLYFDSNRPGGHSDSDLWCIRRRKK